MATSRRLRAAAGALAEGALLGSLGAVLPLPVSLVIAPVMLGSVLLAAFATQRVEAFVLRLTRLGGCVAACCIACSLPFKPLDARLHLPADPTVAEVLAGLESAGIRTRTPPDLAGSMRLDLRRDPRARVALDAVAEATGST